MRPMPPKPKRMPSLRKNTLTLLASLAILATSLAGCVTADGKPGRVCPPLIPYSQAYLNETADELEEILDRYPHVARMVSDYGVTRKHIRACLGQK